VVVRIPRHMWRDLFPTDPYPSPIPVRHKRRRLIDPAVVSSVVCQYWVLPPHREDTSLLLRSRRLLHDMARDLDLDVGPVG
jgi:hypothetical protein